MVPDSPENRTESLDEQAEGLEQRSTKDNSNNGDLTTTSEANEERVSSECEDLDSESNDQRSVIDELELRIEKLKAVADDAKDRELRAHAEAENIRRRSAREYEQVRKFALESFAKELLPALDNFATAIKTAKDQEIAESVLQGIELSVKTLVDAMSRNGITEFDPTGEVFDPDRHMAMTSIEHPDVEPGTVVEVFRRGYLIHDRLLREAEVIVAKAPSSDEDKDASKA